MTFVLIDLQQYLEALKAIQKELRELYSMKFYVDAYPTFPLKDPFYAFINRCFIYSYSNLNTVDRELT
jgi:hypothetical protein